MTVSRREGYERAAGKERLALDVVDDFCRQVLALSPVMITERDDNRLHGDLRVTESAECKGQPIDPDKYDRNFVEVMEDTSSTPRDYHRDGFNRTAQILCMRANDLAAANYVDCRTPRRERRVLGHVSHASASLESVAGSALTIYANPDPRRTYVYCYSKTVLLGMVREQVVGGGLRRGQGNANEDSFAVFVPVSPARWRREGARWSFVGDGRPPIDRIRKIFLAEVAA